MFKRIRQMQISLAAKCQLLFGAAVILIIGAALFVPWQRMEQLTDQINERSAKSLCEDTVADHLAEVTPSSVRPTTLPTSQPSAATINPRVLTTPRLVWMHDPPADLSPFERRAIKHFEDHPEADEYARLIAPPDGSAPEYRYARVLRGDAGCARCHYADAASNKILTDRRSPDAAAPATRPGNTALVGMVTL